MKVELIKTEGNKVSFKLTVDNDKFEAAITKAYNKNKGKYNIPGFRKGKAPRKVIETHYGKGVFYSDAIDIVFPKVYPAAIAELNLDPIDMPGIDVEEISKDNGLVMLVDVEVKPAFELGQYKGVEVEKVEETVNEELINARLEEMREKNSRLVSVEREIANGDTANIDFEGFDGDVAFEGGKDEKYDLVIGSNSFIPGFEEQLVGKKVGEEVEVNVTFPEEYQAENLAGKPVVFKVKVNEVKVKELPELNDEFASDTTEFNTLEELRADVTAKAEEEAQATAQNLLRNKIIDVVVANTEVEVPEVMVNNEIENQINELSYQLQSQGFGMEQFLQMTGKTMEQFKTDFAADRKEEAVKNVKTSLVIEAIAKVEDVQVSEEEVNVEVEKMATAYNMTVEQVKGALRETDLKDMEGQLKIRKTIDLLVDSAKIA
ncbi:MAG: trigger factor [Terrisporobacter sp.]